MKEQQLRAAVAEYDAEMARNLVFRDGQHEHGQWFVSRAHIVRLVFGGLSMSAPHHDRVATTMRAMDAAARAFEEALK